MSENIISIVDPIKLVRVLAGHGYTSPEIAELTGLRYNAVYKMLQRNNPITKNSISKALALSLAESLKKEEEGDE